MRLIYKGRLLQRHLANCKSLLISFFYFTYQSEFNNVLQNDNIDFCTGIQERIFTWPHIINRGLHVIRSPTIDWSRFSIWFIFHPCWRTTTTPSFLLDECPPGGNHPNNGFINEELPIFSIHSTLIQRHPTCSIKQSGKECWVRLGSSTWNVLWFWNNNERRLRLLEKNNWREQLRSLPTNSRQAKRSWKRNND